MEWTGSTKAVFCLVAFLHLSCNYQRMVSAAPCIAQTLTITADNKLVVFLDGVQVLGLQHANSPGNADAVQVPASIRVIAVSAENNGQNGGILGSTPTFVTDESWKCTNQFFEGWQEVDFDDTAWEAAYVVGPHGIKPWQQVVGVRADAFWIWVTPGSSGKNVFCRKRIDCGVTTPTPTQPPTPPPDPMPQLCRGGSGETGPSCITSCGDLANGDYQSCKGCQVYALCHNGILHDNRPCSSDRYWDDKVKRCEGKSATCQECK